MLDSRIHPKHRLILLRLSGRLSVEEILEFLAAVRVEPDYDTTYRSLVDLCGLATTRCAVVTASFFQAKLANISTSSPAAGT